MSDHPEIKLKTRYGTAVLHLHSATSGYIETEGGRDQNPTPWSINGVSIAGWAHLEKSPAGVWGWPRGSWPSIKRVGVDWQKADNISLNLSRKWNGAILEAVREWAKTGAAAETRAEAVSLENSAQHDEENAAELEIKARDLRQKAAASRKKAAALGAAPGFLFEDVKSDGGVGA